MRIATWNLRRPGSVVSPRAKALAAQILAVDADIWVLTETREELSPGDGYAGFATSGSDRKQSPGEQWTMIWSRLAVVGTEPTADPIRTVCVRVAMPSGRCLLVYGTVLPWRADQRWLPLRGGAAFVHALRAQQEDWRRLRRQYPNDVLCLAGDFNQDLGPRVYAGTAKGRDELRNLLNELSLTCLTGEDADPVAARTGGVRRNIDHICLGSDRQLTKVRQGAWPGAVSELKGLTDHFGVWVDCDELT